MIKFIKSISQKVGIDGAIAYTLFTRIVQGLGGLGSIFFIARYLSGPEQGYYYTFASLIALQVFFELGLSGIITQYTAHEFAHLKIGEGGNLIGEEYHKSRVASLLQFCIKWFGIISGILLVVLIICGVVFFRNYGDDKNINWELPWFILCLSTSLNLFIDPILAFFDGLGKIKEMARIRLIQKTTFIALLFLFFVMDMGLYASPLAALVSILVNYAQILFSTYLKILKAVWVEKKNDIIDYVKEILPFQWKIALSWISGYFIFQLFNPVLFATNGAVVAGQMGMTLQALNGISSLSMSWITTKIPIFSNYIALKDFVTLDLVFGKTVKNLIIVNIALTIIFILFLIGLGYYAPSYSLRFLPLLPTILLFVSAIFNQLVFSWATYLRCHKSEPFLLLSIVFAVLVSLSTFLLGYKFGLMGIVIGYVFLMVLVSFPWAYIVYSSKRKEWHSARSKVINI